MNNNQPGKEFDIKRSSDGPPSTSRPIIVGHHPVAPDPMVHRIKTPAPSSSTGPTEPIKVPVLDHSEGVIDKLPTTKKVIQPLSHPESDSPEPKLESKSEPVPELTEPPLPEANAEPASPATTQPVPEDTQLQYPQTPIVSGADIVDKPPIPDTGLQAMPSQISEEMKVHLPAGVAAHESSKTVWVILVVVAVAAGLGVAYFFLVK